MLDDSVGERTSGPHDSAVTEREREARAAERAAGRALSVEHRAELKVESGVHKMSSSDSFRC